LYVIQDPLEGIPKEPNLSAEQRLESWLLAVLRAWF
jgi:hypothetical protein